MADVIPWDLPGPRRITVNSDRGAFCSDVWRRRCAFGFNGSLAAAERKVGHSGMGSSRARPDPLARRWCDRRWLIELTPLQSAGRCDARERLSRTEHHDRRADLDPAIEIDDVLIGQA